MGLSTCCCGCTVKTGSLIVGYIHAVLSGLGVFVCILALIVDGNIHQQEPSDDDVINPSRDVPMIYREAAFKVSLLATVICLKTLLVNCLLIIGINRMKPAFVLPWIIFFGAGMVIKSVMSFYTIGFAVGISTSTTYLITTASALMFFFETYILIVVSSHYHKMKKSSLLDEEQMMM